MEINKYIEKSIYNYYEVNCDYLTDSEMDSYSNCYDHLIENSDFFLDLVISLVDRPRHSSYNFMLGSKRRDAAFCKAVLRTAKEYKFGELDTSGQLQMAILKIYEPLENYRFQKIKESEI